MQGTLLPAGLGGREVHHAHTALPDSTLASDVGAGLGQRMVYQGGVCGVQNMAVLALPPLGAVRNTLMCARMHADTDIHTCFLLLLDMSRRCKSCSGGGMREK